MTEYHYRIIMINRNGIESHWMGKVFGDLASAEFRLGQLRDNASFFRWGTEYRLERRPIIDTWEAM